MFNIFPIIIIITIIFNKNIILIIITCSYNPHCILIIISVISVEIIFKGNISIIFLVGTWTVDDVIGSRFIDIGGYDWRICWFPSLTEILIEEKGSEVDVSKVQYGEVEQIKQNKSMVEHKKI